MTLAHIALQRLLRLPFPFWREFCSSNSYLSWFNSISPKLQRNGTCKASLEANTRFLAASLGKKGIRVNAISAGPIKTLAASGVKNFRSMLSEYAERAPLGRTVTTEEVVVAAFLCSDLASGITGEITYVDAGFNTSAMSSVPKNK